MPTFLSAILLIYLFAVQLRWLPATGYVPFTEDPVGNLRFFVLPALTLALAEWPGIMRVLRSDMIATLQEDYIALAKAKGLKPSRILLVHDNASFRDLIRDLGTPATARTVPTRPAVPPPDELARVAARHDLRPVGPPMSADDAAAADTAR